MKSNFSQHVLKSCAKVQRNTKVETWYMYVPFLMCQYQFSLIHGKIEKERSQNRKDKRTVNVLGDMCDVRSKYLL